MLKVLLLGKATYKVDKPLDILNSQNVEKFFNVKSTIINANTGKKNLDFFVVVDKV